MTDDELLDLLSDGDAVQRSCLIGALASVGIENGLSTHDMLWIYAEQKHVKTT